jgi:hypothetical protein
MNGFFDLARKLCDTALVRPAAYLTKQITAKILSDPHSPYFHPYAGLRREALADTMEYIKRNMKSAVIQNDVWGVLDYALKQAPPGGLFLEFGVRTGSTINYISTRKAGETIYGFDSFEGLPEAWHGFLGGKGTFAREDLPIVNPNVQLVKGWFEDTLPGFVAEHEQPVSFIHVDSDLYSSAKTIFDRLAPRIRPGTVIVFNEYFNYPNWREHEYKAFHEFCNQHDVRYEYVCWGYYEVAVIIKGIEFTAPAVAARLEGRHNTNPTVELETATRIS